MHCGLGRSRCTREHGEGKERQSEREDKDALAYPYVHQNQWYTPRTFRVTSADFPEFGRALP